MVTNAFTLYKGFRIHLLEEDDFTKDAQDRYLVHVHITKPGMLAASQLEVPGCFASTLEQAQELSVAQAMRIIDAGLDPSGRKSSKKSE